MSTITALILGAPMAERFARFRFALDENNVQVSIDDVPKDLKERRRHPHTYICQGCHDELIANKGDHKIYYFRHKHRNGDCDTWSEPMTPWHYNGQDLLKSLGGMLEVYYLDQDGKSLHRADVVLPDVRTVVELQHSSITGEFSERNEFYLAQEGIDNLVWIFDGREFACRMSLLFPDDDYDADTGFADAANRQDMEGIIWKHRHHWYRDFEDDPMGWTQRGLSIAIYLEGSDEWDDGTILELFPHAHPTSDTLTGHVWRAGDYMRALASGRLPFMRRVPVTYRYQDGSVEQTLCRYGSEMPSPTQCRPLGKAESRKWRSRDGRTLASNVDPHGMVPRDGAEWTETIRKRTVNVAVWLGRNHKTKPRRPEASVDFLITATPDEVVSAVRGVIGEWRADDYDWDVLAGKWEDMGLGAEETGIRCTVPILDGHHRYKCSLEDGRTGQVLATRVWEYEGTPLSACLDALRKKVPRDVQAKYNWEMRLTDSEEVLEEESTWMVYPISGGKTVAVNRREVPVAIKRYEPPYSDIWHGHVMSDVTWAEIVRLVSEALPEAARMYDLDALGTDAAVSDKGAGTTKYAHLTEAGEQEARRRHDEVMRSIREERSAGFRDVLHDVQAMREKQARRAAAPIRKHIVRFLTADGEVLGAYTASHGDMVSEYANRMRERCSFDGSDGEFVWDCVPEARIDGDVEIVVPSSEPVRVVIRLCPEGRDEGESPVETELSLPKGISLGVMQSLVSRYVNGDDGSFCWPNDPDGFNKNIREPTTLILTPWSYRVMPLDDGGKPNGAGDGESEAAFDTVDVSETNVEIAHEDEPESSQLTLIV